MVGSGGVLKNIIGDGGARDVYPTGISLVGPRRGGNASSDGPRAGAAAIHVSVINAARHTESRGRHGARSPLRTAVCRRGLGGV